MSTFIQLHMLTSYPPSNLNRDDLGRPKQAVMGGANRLRVSSQSLKRSWRQSEVFESILKDNKGIRTKELGRQIYDALQEKGVSEKKAAEWAKQIAGQFGKLKTGKKDPMENLEIEQLAHISPEEQTAVDQLVQRLAESNKAPSKEDLSLLRKDHSAADIALFGRMLAANPAYNVEAAAQVAHAITVHKVAVEDDFFTAVDDLNTGAEDAGAGHMGETEFGAGLYYLYTCVNRDLLAENLQNDATLANKALGALLEAAATVGPTGKQNSFGSRARASYILVEKGEQQPRSLSVAFLKPTQGTNMLSDAIETLRKTRSNMDQVYGPCCSVSAELNANSGEGMSLESLKTFVTE